MDNERLGLKLTAIAGLAVAMALGLPRIIDPYYVHVVDITLINLVIAIGLNLVLGFGGQISFAQSAFFGIGAYTFGALQAHGWPAIAAATAAVLLTACIGALLGWPALRLRGHYLALATLSFSLIMGELMVDLDMITGGANGMMNIQGLGLARDDGAMLPILLAVAAVGLGASVAFASSPAGLRTRAFRDNAIAAQAAGVDIRALKIGLFVASAIYAGVAGVCYCCLLGYISPDVFAWGTTFAYLAMCVVGGLGSNLGAPLGAALYTLVPEWLRFLQEAYFVIFGTVVIVVIAVVPGGMAGVVTRLFDRLCRAVVRARPPAPAAPENVP
jgi:branched-chain amino acid transport system permease protein